MAITDRLSSREFAGLVGASMRLINDLANSGVLDRGQDQKFDVSDNVKKYISYKIDTHKTNDIDIRIKQETHRLKKAQADKAEIEVKEAENKLLPVDDMVSFVEDVFATVKTNLLGLGAKMAPQLVSQSSAGAISIIINNAIAEALEEVGNGGGKKCIDKIKRTKRKSAKSSATSSDEDD